ncbi:MAG: hypothetical protein HYY93_13700 [Planctomycetes bacterium]|nr:hypothetical protein [Planctomycetota bacterium]
MKHAKSLVASIVLLTLLLAGWKLFVYNSDLPSVPPPQVSPPEVPGGNGVATPTVPFHATGATDNEGQSSQQSTSPDGGVLPADQGDHESDAIFRGLLDRMIRAEMEGELGEVSEIQMAMRDLVGKSPDVTVPPLLGAIEREPVEKRRLPLLAVLVSAKSEKARAYAAQEIVADREWNTLEVLAQILAHNPSPENLLPLKSAIRSQPSAGIAPGGQARGSMFKAVALIDDQDSTDYLREQLVDSTSMSPTSTLLREEVLSALAWPKSPATETLLWKVLKNAGEVSSARRQALTSLSLRRSEDPGFGAVLLPLFEDERDPSLKSWMMTALVQGRSPSDDAIRAFERTASDRTTDRALRSHAVQVLATLGDKGSLQILEDTLRALPAEDSLAAGLKAAVSTLRERLAAQ